MYSCKKPETTPSCQHVRQLGSTLFLHLNSWIWNLMASGLGHLMGLIGGRSPQVWANRVKKVPVETKSIVSHS